MWKISAQAMVLGAAMFISGCPNCGMDHVKLAAAREFYDQPVKERIRTFRQHSLEDQLDLFFFGNQFRHPPAVYLAPCFALNGPPCGTASPLKTRHAARRPECSRYRRAAWSDRHDGAVRCSGR